MANTVLIAGRKIAAGEPPYLVAEISANHNGSLEKALELISLAKESGADAVKIQTYTPDTMTIQSDAEDFMIREGPWAGYRLYDLYKEAQTPFEWHSKMFEYAAKIGITIFSTPFDESAVDLLVQLGAPAFKIASFEMTDLPLIRYVASKGRPMIISTGMACEAEITETLSAAREAGCSDIILLHCVSSYPAPVDQFNLSVIQDIPKRFDVLAGLSDHSIGNTAAVAATALGAVLVEKHFTRSRLEKGPDSGFSIEPAELKQLCHLTRDASTALGRVAYKTKPAEAGSVVFRRSIYFVRDLAAGVVITRDDLRRIRPGYGLPPKYLEQLIGKKAAVDIRAGTAASWKMVTD